MTETHGPDLNSRQVAFANPDFRHLIKNGPDGRASGCDSQVPLRYLKSSPFNSLGGQQSPARGTGPVEVRTADVDRSASHPVLGRMGAVASKCQLIARYSHTSTLVAVLIFFLLSSPLSAESIGWQYYAFSITGQLTDAATTTRGLDAGLREGNPRLVGIAGKPAVLFTVKAGIGLGVGYLGDRVYRHGVKHRSKGFRIAGKALPIVAGAAGFIAAGVNERRRAGR